MTTSEPGRQPDDQPPGPGQYGPGQQYGQPPYSQGQQHGRASYGQGHHGQPPYNPGQQHGQPSYRPPSGDDRTIAVLAHLSPLIALVLSAGWLSFVGPLLVWLIWKDRGPLVRNASASAFNFNITVWIASIAAWLCLFTIILIPVSIVLWIAAFVAQLVLSIRGAMHANRGEVYRYPLQVPILS